MKSKLATGLVLALLFASVISVGATFGNGTKGFWNVSSDPILTYKGSVTMKFKATSDFNFGQFDNFEIAIWDSNSTAPLDYNFVNEYITKTISINSAKTEVTITLKSLTVPYTTAVANGLKAKNYYLTADLRKFGDTALGVDAFKAVPISVRWDVSTMDLTPGVEWSPTSPELEYTKSLTVTYEGYIDQFKYTSNVEPALGINGLDAGLKSDYFKTTYTKVNDRTIRVTIDSEQIPTLLLYEKAVEAKKYDAYILFPPDLNVPMKTFKVDLTSMPQYVDSGTSTTNYAQLVADLQAEIVALNAEITALENQIGTTGDAQTELANLRSLRNDIVAWLSGKGSGATTTSTNAYILAEIQSFSVVDTSNEDALNWRTVQLGTGVNDAGTMVSTYSTYKTAYSDYTKVVAERNSLTTQKANLEAERNTLQARVDGFAVTEQAYAKLKQNMVNYLVGVGIAVGLLGIVIGWKMAPKNGNRPRPPMPKGEAPREQRLKPHRHKGGVPAQSVHMKKKDL